MRNRVLSVVLALALVAFVPTLSAFADEGAVGLTEQSGGLTTMAEPITNVIITRTSEDQYTVEFDSDGSGGDFYIDPLANGASIFGASMGGSAGLLVTPGHKELPFPFAVDLAGTVTDAVALSLFQSNSKVWSGIYPIPAWNPPAADTTPPLLSNGKFLGWVYNATANRDVATFTFDTDDGGLLYLNFVSHGDPAPNLSHVATIPDENLDPVSAGTVTIPDYFFGQDFPARDYYICVRDAAGNVSQPLMISTVVTAPPTDYTVVTEFPAYEGKGDVSAQIDAPFAEFVQLTLDGKVVDPAHYTITEDTFTITLAKAYLDTLARGEYVFVVEFSGGTAQLPLSIQTMSDEDTPPAQEADTLPKTGDSMVPLATVLLLLAGGTTLLLRSRRRAA